MWKKNSHEDTDSSCEEELIELPTEVPKKTEMIQVNEEEMEIPNRVDNVQQIDLDKKFSSQFLDSNDYQPESLKYQVPSDYFPPKKSYIENEENQTKIELDLNRKCFECDNIVSVGSLKCFHCDTVLRCKLCDRYILKETRLCKNNCEIKL